MTATSDVGVFTVDRDLVVQSWDPWVSAVTGVPADRARGASITSLIPDIVERGLLSRFERVREEGAVEVLAPAFHHYLIRCAPRVPSDHFAVMQQSVTLTPLRVEGRVAGVVVTIEDVTARLDRERTLAGQLRGSDEQVRQFAARELAIGAPSVLVDSLGDTDWRVRRAAAAGLSGTDDRDAVNRVVAIVRDHHEDAGALNAAITALSGSMGAAVPRVIEVLRSDDPDARTYAALALGLMRDEWAVEPLLDCLGDKDPNVRFHAIEALGRIGAPRAAPAIATEAESNDPVLAFAALDALSAIGDPLVAPRIVPLLADEFFGGAAAECVSKIGGEEIAGVLAGALTQPSSNAATIAVAIVTLRSRMEERYGTGTLVEELVRSMVDAVGIERLIAAVPSASDAEIEALAVVLGWLPHASIDPVLGHLLARAKSRNSAAKALAVRGDRGVDMLISALSDDDADVRCTAAAALGEAGNRRAVAPLCELLDRDPDAAPVVASALGAIGSPDALPALDHLLDDQRAAVRHAAIGAINSVAYDATQSLAARLLVDPSAHRREAGARIAGYFGFASCADAMLALCHDADETVRRAAVEHLSLLNDPRTEEILTEALRNESPAIRAAAAKTLATFEAPTGEALLERALSDSDMWVRYFAARSARRRVGIGPALVARLAELAANDPLPPVRLAAIDTLGGGTIGAPELLPVITKLVDDEDGEVRRAAILALGTCKLPGADRELIRALDHEDADRRRVAIQALSLMEPVSSGAVDGAARIARGQFGDDDVTRAEATALLGRVATPRAIGALSKLAASPVTRRAAVAALAAAVASGRAKLARELASPDETIRAAMIEALARAGSRDAAGIFVAALDDASPTVRLEAARALGRLDMLEAERIVSPESLPHG